MLEGYRNFCDNCDNKSKQIRTDEEFMNDLHYINSNNNNNNKENFLSTKEFPRKKFNLNKEFRNKKTKHNNYNCSNNQNNNFIVKTEIFATAERSNETCNKSNDLVKAEEFDKKLCESSKTNRMHLALNLLISLANGLQNLIRLRGFQGEKFWKAAYAYAANTISMGLSSVQVSNRIEPILKIIKFKKFNKITDESSHTTIIINTPKIKVPDLMETAEECVTLDILAEPPPNVAIRADIIFIHGLHGSLVNTWKQGLWSNERNPVEFERPPRPPLRPPKRPRHSRSNIFIPPHSNKKSKLENNNCNRNKNEKSSYLHVNDMDDCDFILDPQDDSKTSESTDTSPFSTFRLRFENFDNSLRSTSPTPPTTPVSECSDNNYNNDEQTSNNVPNSSYSYCWPGDWLPLDCPGVRVIALNYTTDPYLWRPIWKNKYHRSTMTERVRVMTERLIEKKVGCGHPIVWVGHSKGGLFIKQIIVDAWESGKPAAAPLLRSSRGVFFYSVPHRGSHLADINLPLIRRSIELVEIEKNSKVLSDLHRRFVGLYYSGHLKVEVFSFVETAFTFMQVIYLRIVGVDSADPGIGDVCGLQLDHREICKPRSRSCILYTELTKMIQKIC